MKVTWELSRLRHCVALAEAAAVLGDEKCLVELEADLADWHDQNPLGWSVNWTCAMEVALRAVNLICIDALLLAADRMYPSRSELVASLYQHGWFLYRNLEISDINGNHFLANAVGLAWLGRYFEGVGESGRWFRRGMSMLHEAAREQVLPDGLDHEGALPYHALVLELFLVGRVAAGHALRSIDSTVCSMLDALCHVVDERGRVPDIGDDDGGRVLAFSDADSRDARRVLALGGALLRHDRAEARAAGAHPQDAVWLAGRMPSAPGANSRETAAVHLGHGGIVVLGDGRDHIVVDVGTIGFRGRGGHGHLDAMSFEATLDGDLAVRDSGTGGYTRDPDLRNELRSVRAHNVVVVDGLPYAYLGGRDRLWRIDGDAPPAVLAFEGGSSGQRLVCAQRIPARRGWARYERELWWRPGRLDWRDRVEAPFGSSVEHLVQMPDDASSTGDGFTTARFDYRLEAPHGAVVTLERCLRSRRYGSVTQSWRTVVAYEMTSGIAEVSWSVSRR